jgi:hypothetical protein
MGAAGGFVQRDIKGSQTGVGKSCLQIVQFFIIEF